MDLRNLAADLDESFAKRFVVAVVSVVSIASNTEDFQTLLETSVQEDGSFQAESRPLSNRKFFDFPHPTIIEREGSVVYLLVTEKDQGIECCAWGRSQKSTPKAQSFFLPDGGKLFHTRFSSDKVVWDTLATLETEDSSEEVDLNRLDFSG